MLLIKVGGGAAIHWEGLAEDVAALIKNVPVVLIHGASVKRDEIAEKLGAPTRTVVSPSGISSVYTDSHALDVFLMVYAGLANKRAVAALQRHGVNAIGLSGVDGRLWQAKAKRDLMIQDGDKVKLLKDNLTGRVEAVNTDLIRLLLGNGYCPVLCPPALSFEDEIVNTDNDWAAAVMAEALGIRTMVVLFEAPGFLENAGDEKTLIPEIKRAELDSYLPLAKGRMKKKVLGAKRALEGGVEAIYWGDGRIAHPVSNAMAGRGTIIR